MKHRIASPAVALVLLLMTLSSSALAQVFPYEEVANTGRNNIVDSTALSCDSVEGCYTRQGQRCSDIGSFMCDLQIVPAGRCSYGNLAPGLASCVWPHRAGHCSGNNKVGCLANNQCTVAGGTCLLTTDIFGAPYEPTACNCQGTNSALPDFESAVCGGVVAICSDGDLFRARGGLGVAFGVELSLGGPATFPKLGPTLTGSVRPNSSPAYELESPPSVFDPQRDAGTIGRGSSGTGPIHPVRTTNAREVLPYQHPAVAIPVDARMYTIYGDSYWSDWAYETSFTTGTFNTHYVTLPCDFPVGWVVGTPLPSGLHCHQAARNSKGFVWRSDLTPAQQTAFTSGGRRVCPPNCNKDFSLATTEFEELFEVAAQDPNAGIQLAMQSGDEGPGHQAIAGDAIEVTQLWRGMLFVDSDLRCRVGAWGNAVGFVGRCSDGADTCDPDAVNCGMGVACCIGQGGSCRACNGPFDAGTNPLGLPIGYNTHGRSELDLVAGQRIGGITGANVDVKIPLFLIGTTGSVTTEFRDKASEGLPALDVADMGPVDPLSSFASGIGSGGTFMNGVDLNIDEVCCGTGVGANVIWDPAQLGTVVPGFENGFVYSSGVSTYFSDWALTYDIGPGADGIPGCFGDNEVNPQTGANSCRQRLGVGAIGMQSNGFFATGRDDRTQVLQVGSSIRPASKARYFWGDSLPAVVSYFGNIGNPPVVNTVAAYSARDQFWLVPRAADLLMKVNKSACPLTNAGPQCDRLQLACMFGQGGDTDLDDVCNPVDNCPTVANATQDNNDGDALGDACDNCPTVSNADQADGASGLEVPADGVGDVCDNCVRVNNPRVTPNTTAYLASNPWRTLTGGQIDDDHDGYGNKCDAKFVGLPSSAVSGLDLAQFRASVPEDRRFDTCGTNDTRPCAIFDLDEAPSGNSISGLDLGRFRQLNSALPGPRCAGCTGTGSTALPCTAGTAGTCF